MKCEEYKSLLEGANNTRIITNGIWRSGALNKLTDSDIKNLLKNDIRTIIDLRGFGTASRIPCVLCSDKRFEYHNIPVESEDTYQQHPDWESYYEMVLYSTAIPRVLECILNSDHGVIINCTAGKDRTGVVAAILEHILGFSRVQIIEDYLLSTCYLADWFVEWERLHGLSVEENTPTALNLYVVLNDPYFDSLRDSELGIKLRSKYKI